MHSTIYHLLHPFFVEKRGTAVNKFGLNDQLTMGGKRPRSSMSPMLALDGDGNPIFSAGSPGGQTIIGTVFGVMYNGLIRDMDMQEAIDIGRIWSYNGNNPSGEWSSFRNENSNFNDQMSARGYGFLTPSAGGRCHGVKIGDSPTIPGLKVFYGGADDTRWATAMVGVLCDGDGTIPDPNPFCQGIIAKSLLKGSGSSGNSTDDKGDDVNRLSVFAVCILLMMVILF